MSVLNSLIGPICVLGIYGCFMASGVFQEAVFKPQKDDPRINDQFKFPLFLVFGVSLGSALSAFVLLMVEHKGNLGKVFACLYQVQKQGKERIFEKDPKFNRQLAQDFFMVAMTYVTAMVTANYALTLVNYPTQVLVKSAKMVPVVIFGVLLYRKSYPWYDYVGVCLITSSLILFNMYDPEDAKKGGNKANSLGGIALCFASLICDGLTGSRQDKVNKAYVVTSNEHMFFTNLFACLPSLLATLAIDGLSPVNYLVKWPEVVVQILGYCLCMTCGQVFIFMSLTHFGALYLALITTTRKFFTVLLSYFWFPKEMTIEQAVAIGVIFFALMLQVVCSAKDKAKAKAKHAPQVNNVDAHKPLVENDVEAQKGRH